MRGPRDAAVVVLATAAIIVGAALPATAGAEGYPRGPMATNLQGDKAIPSPGPFGLVPDPSAYGAFSATCDYGECCYTYEITGFTAGSGAVQTHLYRGADGVNGTPIYTLRPPGRDGSTVMACTPDMPNGLVSEMVDSPERFYIQVTGTQTAYAIRGQLASIQYGHGSTLSPKGGLFSDPEIAGVYSPNASLSAIMPLPPGDPGAAPLGLCYGYTARYANATTAAIRKGQPFDQATDPVVFNLGLKRLGPSTQGGTGCITRRSAAMTEIQLHPERFFLELQRKKGVTLREELRST